jgi:hypothetical protein
MAAQGLSLIKVPVRRMTGLQGWNSFKSRLAGLEYPIIWAPEGIRYLQMRVAKIWID